MSKLCFFAVSIGKEHILLTHAILCDFMCVFLMQDVNFLQELILCVFFRGKFIEIGQNHHFPHLLMHPRTRKWTSSPIKVDESLTLTQVQSEIPKTKPSKTHNPHI